MKRLALLGASGHGKVVADIAQSCDWREIVFFDDAWPDISQNSHWPVVGNSEHLLNQLDKFDGVFVAIGRNKIRAQKLERLQSHFAPIISLVHPSAVISQYSRIGPGSVVMPGVVVNVDAKVGAGVILNTGCSIDHDCVLADCVHVSPGARLAGGVRVGRLSWIGIGAVVLQMIAVGEHVIVGAGAAVVKDISDGLTVVGVPASPI